MNKKTSLWTKIAPVVVLTGICVVVTAALALTNSKTAPIIADRERSAQDSAKKVVLRAGADFEAVTDLKGLPPAVIEATKAGNGAGYVLTVKGRGYGEFIVMVGVGADSKVAGVKVTTQNETADIGGKLVADGSEFMQNLVGITDPKSVQGVSGATLTSNGMKAAVKAALDAAVILSGGTVEVPVVPAPEGFNADKAAAMIPGATFTEVKGGMKSDAGTIVYGEAQGMESVVRVAVAFDKDGTMLGIYAYTGRETEYVGDTVGEDAKFIDQFKGASDVDKIQAVSGATITSTAVKDAVKAAIANLETVKGAA